MTAKAASTTSLTPLRRLAQHSTTTCATQASQYGKCILAQYTDVRKDACKDEFAKFGACLRDAASAIYLIANMPLIRVAVWCR
ncbi:hypothetical protein PUNSTDRAFT_63443 [Punctularia strigosozonata HHB-11173 SS5]|uniref:uncharacterized protein n=1 Tax=Punctularia strigosozonata (strain HHB-11173) TaxID=741275 RepID=UPI0004416753|nr:uncharacterized protein PUNSTDRAFT_63443 [Punctularia strigosozonata HHB-11173 SS5]EIN11332.1 hypothetical protein PUNSTDRAFT_63443 [Punctularia strigosozonata HHB-11173 SS5]